MSHTKGITQDQKTSAEEEERTYKAVAHVPAGEGTRSLWVMDELLTHKIPSQRTGGAYSLFEVTTRPGVGPPPHVNHREDESFYVLEGEYEFLVDDRTEIAQAGSLIYVPKGILHAHNGVGKGMCKMLVTQTPGGLYERFFEEVGKPAEDEGRPFVLECQPDMKRIVEIAAEHGIEIPVPITRCSGG